MSNSRRAAFGGVLVAIMTMAPVHALEARGRAALSVRITSPLGRTGVPSTVRIVAQIQAPTGSVLSAVEFFVNGTLLSVDRDGPPYAVEWTDAHPFDLTEISVVVADESGNSARDTVRLKPLEILETSQVTSVLVDATVQDKAGRFVRDLTERDFRLLENGVPQALDLAARDEVPTTFALLVDSSQSMAHRIDFVREAATRLSGVIRPRDRLLVVPFSQELAAITGPTDDRATVSEAIARISPRGGTAIMDGLIELVPHLRGVEGRSAVVLITDGYDEHSESRYEDALAALKSIHATVYVVGVGGVAGISLKGERLLRRLAAETGGRAFMPSRETEFWAVHDALAADVQNRYILSYTPTNQQIDGAWRTIAVDTVHAGLTVRARDGYFAPTPPPVRPSIEFTITDEAHQFRDVAIEDLEVEEAGVAQTLETFEEAVTPVSIILALDGSGSMKRSVEAARSAAASFVDALRPEDHLSVLLFADTVQTAHGLGIDRAASHAAIAEYRAAGGTALYDAVGESLDALKPVVGRRVIVVVTDGRDENNPGTAPGSLRTFDQVLLAAREVDAVVFGIGIGPKVDRPVLEALAAASGGEALFPQDAGQLEHEYQRVLQNLRRRWIVSYTSTNPTRDGAWRPVTIKTRDGKAVVHSRGGYFAPEK
jgi:Ca-activated chloride channel family protein